MLFPLTCAIRQYVKGRRIRFDVLLGSFCGTKTTHPSPLPRVLAKQRCRVQRFVERRRPPFRRFAVRARRQRRFSCCPTLARQNMISRNTAASGLSPSFVDRVKMSIAAWNWDVLLSMCRSVCMQQASGIILSTTISSNFCSASEDTIQSSQRCEEGSVGNCIRLHSAAGHRVPQLNCNVVLLLHVSVCHQRSVVFQPQLFAAGLVSPCKLREPCQSGERGANT